MDPKYRLGAAVQESNDSETGPVWAHACSFIVRVRVRPDPPTGGPRLAAKPHVQPMSGAALEPDNPVETLFLPGQRRGPAGRAAHYRTARLPRESRLIA